MNSNQLYQFLQEHDQGHIVDLLKGISINLKKKLLKQVGDIKSNNYQPLCLEPILKNISFVESIDQAGSEKDIKLGFRTLLENKTGCLIFAGGQAVRLNETIPKGLFKIKGKSLFEHICTQIAAYSKVFNLSVPLIVLVSKHNKFQVEKHFKEHACFGLCPPKILLLEQADYPCFDENGRWVISPDLSILQAPNGNGGFFEALQRPKAKKFLKEHQLQYLHLIPVDNPINDPLDLNLLGALRRFKLDAIIKVFKKNDINEKVGSIYQSNQKHLVADYMQLSDEDKKLYQYANGGHYCLKVLSLYKLEKKGVFLPYHFVKKKANEGFFIWKGEKFVFDTFQYFSKVSSLCYDKKLFFAPLKEKKDIAAIEKSLALRDAFICEFLNVSVKCSLSYEDFINYLKKKASCL